MILYKYRTDSQYTEAIFRDRKIWLSTAKQLNDPFECTISEIAGDWIDSKVQEAMNAHITGFFHSASLSLEAKKNFMDLRPSKTKALLKKLSRYRDMSALHYEIKEFYKSRGMSLSDPRHTFARLDEQLQNVGIFSLSSNPTQQLMWAHYGGESKGIAIGFCKRDDTKLANIDHCIKVGYSNAVPAFEGNALIAQSSLSFTENGLAFDQQISFSDPTFRTAISTKAESWSYEEEWRYVEETSGAFDYPAPISEIVFGQRCPDYVRKKYILLAREFVAGSISFKAIVSPKNTRSLELVTLYQEEIDTILKKTPDDNR